MRYWKIILIGLLAIYALPVLGYIIFGTLGANGASDFHQFWYAGQFILVGRDPYQAFFSGVSLPMRQPGLEITPSNSPLLTLGLTLFSFLPWTVAKVTWLVLNLLLTCLSFWLVVEKIPFPKASLDRQTKLLIFLIFFDLSPTRIAIENGQTTLLVFVLMLAALLLAERSWLWSGLLLGLALSKFSVSIPVVLFLMYHGNLRVLVTAFLAQLLGFAGLAALSGNSILLLLEEYVQLLISLINQPGIHLASLIPGTWLDEAVPALMSIVMVAVLYVWLIRRKPAANVNTATLDFHMLTIFVLWSLLVAYHRIYDALMLLLLIVLTFKALQQNIWNLSPRMRAMLPWGLGLGLALLIIPARVVDMLVPGTYDPLTNSVPAVILLTFICVLMTLFHRFLYSPVSEAQ